MVRVDWSREAVANVEAIRAYIEQFDARAAARITERLLRAGASLAEFPDGGRPLSQGRRQLSVVWPYLLIYRREGDVVSILSVRHGARQWDSEEG